MPRRVDTSALIAGQHAVEAQLRDAPRQINHLVIQLGLSSPKIHALQKMAETQGIRIHQLPKARLDSLFGGPHQGIMAFLDARPLDEWETVRAELLMRVKNQPPPLVVVPAAIEDPRNLGAIIRSSVALGVDCLLWHNKGTAGLTPTASKSAAGTEHQIALCRVHDIEKALKQLRDGGFTLIGLDGAAESPLDTVTVNGPIALVLGGEDRGIPPHVGRSLNLRAKLRMSSKAQSYNASVALSLALYELNRKRGFDRL